MKLGRRSLEIIEAWNADIGRARYGRCNCGCCWPSQMGSGTAARVGLSGCAAGGWCRAERELGEMDLSHVSISAECKDSAQQPMILTSQFEAVSR